VREAWIVAAVRTPIGRYGGALAGIRPDDLGALALKSVLERGGVPASEIEDVYMGCANQAGEDNRNVARMSLLLAGYPVAVPGCTVNRLCGSGLEAVACAARAIRAEEGHVYVAGGVESMTRAPWAMPKPDAGFPRSNVTIFDTALGWRFVNPRQTEMGNTDSMGQTAENLALEYGIDRKSQDLFALDSHRKALAAIDGGQFQKEIVPVPRKSDLFSVDEGPRRETSLEKLSALKPAFKEGGTVTAGNSSTLNDGAAALLVASDSYVRAHGLKPVARILSFGVAGVSPRIMGIGPVPAALKALSRAQVALADMDLIELNEAFAAQALAVLQGLGIDRGDSRVNTRGGAIALGHPLGCSGARILTTLVHALEEDMKAKLGLATMCIGVGQGIAMVVERI